MSCCGNKRQEWVNLQKQTKSGNEPAYTPPPAPEVVPFEYTGEDTFSISGPITGNTYQFNYHGHTLEVDYRDTPFMMGVGAVRKRK